MKLYLVVIAGAFLCVSCATEGTVYVDDRPSYHSRSHYNHQPPPVYHYQPAPRVVYHSTPTVVVVKKTPQKKTVVIKKKANDHNERHHDSDRNSHRRDRE